MARLLRSEGDRNSHSVSRVAGRRISLVSVGMLFVSSVIVAAISGVPSSGSHSSSAAGHTATNPGSESAGHAAGAPGSSAGNPGSSELIPLQINVGDANTSSLVCPVPQKAVTSVRTTDQTGRPALTASTFCRHSSWYVWERIGPTTAKSFALPDDPPIPPQVIVTRFVNVLTGSLPAVLVDRDDFGNAVPLRAADRPRIHPPSRRRSGVPSSRRIPDPPSERFLASRGLRVLMHRTGIG